MAAGGRPSRANPSLANAWLMDNVPILELPRWHHDWGGGGAGILRPRGHIPRFWTGGCHRNGFFPPIFFSRVCFGLCELWGVWGGGAAENHLRKHATDL